MKLLIWLKRFCVVFTFVLCFFAISPNAQAQTLLPTVSNQLIAFGENQLHVTKNEYEEVETGMSYEEVKDIIGEPGEELSSVEFPGIGKSVMYSWRNDNFSTMTAMFTGNRLVSKSQFGLK
jgi:hypothetical protein